MIFAEASGSRLTGFKVTNIHEVAFQTSCHFHKIAESTVPYNKEVLFLFSENNTLSNVSVVSCLVFMLWFLHWQWQVIYCKTTYYYVCNMWSVFTYSLYFKILCVEKQQQCTCFPFTSPRKKVKSSTNLLMHKKLLRIVNKSISDIIWRFGRSRKWYPLFDRVKASPD